MNRVTDILENQLISFYISGLKPTIQCELLIAKPTTLGDAFSLARITKAQLEDQAPASVTATNTTASVVTQKQSTPRWISAAERQERLNKGLCFNCDNRLVRGHKCPRKFLLLMADDGDDTGQEPEADVVEAVESGDISILNSLVGHGSPRSLQLWGTIGSGNVHVLIDNGSTHNFVRPDVVERMCLPIKAKNAFKVYIGSGKTLMCESLCSQGPDVVLGIQWLQKLGKVTHDYAQQTMEFTLVNTTYTLKGDVSLRMRKFSLPREADGPAAMAVATESEHLELNQLLARFDSLFQVPMTLPPHRVINHGIHLLPNTKPVNVCPYRYPHYQKGEMEKLVTDMLSQGIIRYSQSPFSSLVLLVKKKDGRYRFCVDYRALNDVTIKDKFPIPTADEMFDELGGAVIFTKLDLRVGYHQIRVHERDVYKTAFRTQDGHYEFLVMPFGLTNAPFTFHATMNRLFSSYLRKFEHQFYVKRSKCVFRAATLEYLGHIISVQGVEMDPKKITTVMEWPVPKTQRQFFSRKLGPRMRVAATYQKELFAIVEAIYKWRQYLMGWRFTIHTNHKSIKELMQLVILTPLQQKYVRKLMGFDFSIEYKPGVANQSADALSRMFEDDEQVMAAFMALSQPVLGLLNDLRRKNEFLEELKSLHQKLDSGDGPLGFRRENGLLIYQDRYYLGHASKLKLLLLREYHETPSAGHGGIKKMMVGLAALLDGDAMSLSVVPYPSGASKVAVVEDLLVERDKLLRQLKTNLLAAKERMELKANKRRRDIEFKVGDMVLVKLQPYRQVTLAKRISNKLAKRYYGPYEVVERISKVAYRLALPATSKIHPVFHVSILKDFLGKGDESVTELPEEVQDSRPREQPVAVCDSRENAYPDYNLGDKVVFEERGNVTPVQRSVRASKRIRNAPSWQQDFVMG
ncbi:ty3-gypsy retrotransposon protein [Tanacetum coccineum]